MVGGDGIKTWGCAAANRDVLFINHFYIMVTLYPREGNGALITGRITYTIHDDLCHVVIFSGLPLNRAAALLVSWKGPGGAQ